MCVAPRDLKEPVSWRFSAFSSTRAPDAARQLARRQHRRLAHAARQSAGRALDIGER